MNPENVLAEFERATRALQAAKNLRTDGLYEDAVSRSYYPVMHAAKAALLIHDAIAESHAAVRRLFGAVLVRKGILEKEWASVLAREQDERIIADYAVGTVWKPEAVSHLIEEAEAFIQRIHAYLVSVGVPVE